jgi:putative ABC transport system permease protein
MIASALCGAAIVAIALLLAPSPVLAAEFLFGVLAILVVLRGVAGLARAGLRRIGAVRRPLLRLAIANLARPGSSSANVTTALGLGLTLFATVVLVRGTVAAQVRDALPESAPTFFFVDIQPNQAADFDRTVAHFRSASSLRLTPMIRGRIIALNATPSRDAKVSSDAKWVLAGDRGLTYAASPPDGTEITSGRWWPANYTGPTLISFDGDLAPGLGLKLGDTITMNVLGRSIVGRIANFRHVNFRSGRQNFVIILSPGLIDKAPHSFLGSVRVDQADEDAVYKAVTDRFPNVSTVRVREAIAQVNTLLQELSQGMGAASLLTIAAGLLVLAGAIAASGRARLYDATLLKVLGATRGRIAAVYLIEYGLLGALTGILGFAAASLAAWSIAKWLFDLRFVFDPLAALITIGGGASATILFGLAGAWTSLASRPAARLRVP